MHNINIIRVVKCLQMKFKFAVVYYHFNIADMCCPLDTNTITYEETKLILKPFLFSKISILLFKIIWITITNLYIEYYIISLIAKFETIRLYLTVLVNTSLVKWLCGSQLMITSADRYCNCHNYINLNYDSNKPTLQILC